MPRRTSFGIQFAVLIAVGWIIFHLTDSAIAGAMFPAVRAAWKSLRTGLWITHADQNRRRAFICSAFCLATGCWKAAAAALVSVFVFVAVSHFNGNAPNMNRFAATMMVLTGGVALSTLIGLVASLAALFIGIRVWVHPGMREMAFDNLGAVKDLPEGIGFNHAIFVLATSMAFPVLALCSLLLIDFRSNQFTWAVMIVGVLLAMLGYALLAARIIASQPADCWT